MTHLRTIATATILTLSVSACSTSGTTPPMQATSAGAVRAADPSSMAHYAQPDASTGGAAVTHAAASPTPAPTIVPLPATISPHPLHVSPFFARPEGYVGNTISPHPTGLTNAMRREVAGGNTISPHPTQQTAAKSVGRAREGAIAKTISPHPIIVIRGGPLQSARTRVRASVPSEAAI